MRSTTAWRRGDVVLVRFVFTDESGAKLRPALVLSSAAFHLARQEVIVAAITSNLARNLLGDHVVADWHTAGLPLPSVVTGILRTIRRSMICRPLGRITEDDLGQVDRNLRLCLEL